MLRRADAREQSGGGRDDDARRSGVQRVQRPRARRRDVHVRRQAAIGVDLMRWERKEDPFGLRVREAFDGRHEETCVRREPLDLGIARDHDEHPIARRGGGGEERLRRRREPRHPVRAHTHPHASGRGLQQGTKGERCGSEGGHVRRFEKSGTFNCTT